MTPGEIVAQVAHEQLDVGPMGSYVRVDDYTRFLDEAFGNGKSLRTVATSCAIFAGACLIHAGIQGRRKWPERRAITTWLGVRGFVEDDPETDLIEGAWIPVDEATPEPGDIFYICSERGTISLGGGKFYTWDRWQGAANGHVGILIEGAGPMWLTAEGGGGKDGTLCRKSDGPKNIYELSRALRGFWRPSLMLQPEKAT